MLDFKASQDVLITEPQKKRFAGKITRMIITGVGAGNASLSLNPAKSRLDHCMHMQYVQNIQGQLYHCKVLPMFMIYNQLMMMNVALQVIKSRVLSKIRREIILTLASNVYAPAERVNSSTFQHRHHTYHDTRSIHPKYFDIYV